MSPEKAKRIAEAYAMLAELGYRPAAPSDGVGGITVPSTELEVGVEAQEYARRFLAEEDTDQYYAGCTDFNLCRAAVLTLEAFRLMNAGRFWRVSDPTGPDLVPALLQKASEEYARVLRDEKNAR